MSYAPPVSAHAVLRYLTRVEKFDLAPIVREHGRDASNWTLAIAAAAKLGVPVIELQKRICPEHLASAVRGGVARIRREGLILHCQGGIVATISDELHGKACKMLSRREMRKGIQTKDRRRP